MASSMTVATAAASGDIVAVKNLLEEGADVNSLSSDGMTPLITASFWGYADIVKLLLDHGADVNLCIRSNKWTPLHCAAFQGHGKVIMHLMNHDPDLYSKDTAGRTPVDFASAMDAVWSFFAAAGCKRTPKAELIRMDIIKKVSVDDPSIPKSDLVLFAQSRPGSAYVMQPQSLRGDPQYSSSREALASMTGDVLAGTPDDQTWDSNTITFFNR